MAARKGICLSIASWFVFLGLVVLCLVVSNRDVLLNIGMLVVLVAPSVIIAFLMLIVSAAFEENSPRRYLVPCVGWLFSTAVVVLMLFCADVLCRWFP